MKALILGCGSIGSRHARNLRDLGVDVLLTDVNIDRAQSLARDLGARAVRRASAPDVDLVVVATPTSDHVSDLEEALQRCRHVFIEKPLAVDNAGVERALDLVDRHPDAQIMVGCNLRFTEGFRVLSEAIGMVGRLAVLLIDFGWWLPSWRPEQDYRQHYSAQRDLGGGIILDAIHEIDYSLVLAGPALGVRASWAQTGLLELDVEDVADIVVSHQNGVRSHIHVDYLRRRYSRSCVVVGGSAELAWDFAAGTVTVQREPGGHVEVLGSGLDRERNRQYVDEMTHLLDAIESRTAPTNGVGEAAMTTRVALEALRVGARR
jgi:predicted dehydrogenase